MDTMAAISDLSLVGALSHSAMDVSAGCFPAPHRKQWILAASESLWGGADLPSRQPAPHAFFLLALRARRPVGNEEDVRANCTPEPGERKDSVPVTCLCPLLLAARPSLRGM